MKRAFLNHIHYFRAIAILFVVASHIIPYRENCSESLRLFVFIFAHNGTVFFTFISGFLFEYLSNNFMYKKFLKKKVLYVFIPFIVMSLFTLLINTLFFGPREFSFSIVERMFQNDKLRSCMNFLFYILLGHVEIPFWYIPFIMIIYIISPFILRLVHSQNSYFIFFQIIICLIIPYFFPRNSEFSINNIMYFLCVFILGGISSRNYDFIREKIIKNWVLLLFLSFLFILLQIISFDVVYYNFLQKLFMVYALLGILNRLETRDFTFLKKIADSSFAIYFIHPLVISFYVYVFYSPTTWISWFIMYFVVFALSYIGTLIIKKVLKEKSRYFIGS